MNFTQAAGVALSNASRAVENGTLGDLIGADIIVTYQAWPRAWQEAADWLRFRPEGGMTREVISHFLFFRTHLGVAFSKMGTSLLSARERSLQNAPSCTAENSARPACQHYGSVGGAQPDRQELTIKGTSKSKRISEFYIDAVSDGGDFLEFGKIPQDPRAASLRAQLDDLLLCINGQPHRLATLQEALRVQRLVEAMLLGGGH